MSFLKDMYFERSASRKIKKDIWGHPLTPLRPIAENKPAVISIKTNFNHRHYDHRTRYVLVFGVGGGTPRTSHPSGLRQKPSFAFLPLVPRYPTQSSVPNPVQNVITEFVVQPKLPKPDAAQGLGDT
jgi:hypothetical protein